MDTKIPAELGYTSEHEWVAVSGDTATVGITAYAAEQLGDIVYVEPPAVGSTVTAGETCGEVESTKSVSDVYAPVSGEVAEINQNAVDDPELVGSDPYGQGWLFKVSLSAAPDDLLTAEQYAEITGGDSE
ncbi:glycine cleavage system protein GcvH [Allonocardiopsis opalescens]|uniref:Glycine cleavage system H protein n=1 Tax=Allonocardiopsis opalescens TaxID=1144618 RepID=A0A2T0PW16_9ACTN|nr:glycine cleavage system protein GcvH [Allonocardiopsis opalescens]PRX95734.1 glycine cleavage system H protein [Allonocardiopsis opalescens]